MKTIETSIGFKIEVDETRFNDMELFDAIVELDSGNAIALPKVVSKVLGSEKQRLYDMVRDESGRVPMDLVSQQVQEILAQAGEKNS